MIAQGAQGLCSYCPWRGVGLATLAVRLPFAAVHSAVQHTLLLALVSSPAMVGVLDAPSEDLDDRRSQHSVSTVRRLSGECTWSHSTACIGGCMRSSSHAKSSQVAMAVTVACAYACSMLLRIMQKTNWTRTYCAGGNHHKPGFADCSP